MTEIPAHAVPVPSAEAPSYYVWRDGLTVCAYVVTTDQYLEEHFRSEVDANANFVHWAYMH